MFFSEVTTMDVSKLIERMNISKTMGADQIPPNLI